MVDFITHRCDEKPKSISLRKYYGPDDNPYLFNGNRVWLLARNAYDFEYCQEYLEEFGIVKYCPYCGEKLE